MKFHSHKQEIFLTEYLPPLICVAVSLIIYFSIFMFPEQFPNTVFCFQFDLVCLIPLILYWIFKFRVAPFVKGIIYGFSFCAFVLANTLNFYSYFPYYDSLLHVLSGPLCCLFAMYLLVFSGTWSKMSEIIRAVFMFMFSAGIGSIWEVSEYVVDCWDNCNSQHYLDTGIVDTMQDIICNLFGTCLFVLIMIIDVLWNRDKITGFLTDKLSVYTQSDHRFALNKDETYSKATCQEDERKNS